MRTVYYTCTPDLEPLCAGTVGKGKGTPNAVLQDDGGIVMAVTMTGEHTFAEGEANETTYTADLNDVLVMRLAPP